MSGLLQESELVQQQFVDGGAASELGRWAAMDKTCTNILC